MPRYPAMPCQRKGCGHVKGKHSRCSKTRLTGRCRFCPCERFKPEKKNDDSGPVPLRQRASRYKVPDVPLLRR